MRGVTARSAFVTSALAGLVLLQGCGVLPVNRARVVPVAGQGQEQAGRDKAECYRLAQPGEARRPASAAPIVGLALGGPTGMASAYLGAAVGAEIRDARERPADLDRYSECLRDRGYDVDWPD
jgi:hypothetical protein